MKFHRNSREAIVEKNCRKYYMCKHNEFYSFSYTDCEF